MVAPLTRTDKHGNRLRRPPNIEAEIAEALTLNAEQILARASESASGGYAMSSECMLYLIRNDLHSQDNLMVDLLAPILLARVAANLSQTVRGFREPTLSNIREEILGKFALMMVEPSGSMDFYEVRFALALARLRIDYCHKFKRGEDRLVYLEDDEKGDGEPTPPPEESAVTSLEGLDPEQRLMLKQALSALSEQERRILVLHRLGGVAINAGDPSLVSLTGLSERTVRNRLRSAEATLAAYKERGL